MVVTTGKDTSLVYSWETNFNDAPDTTIDTGSGETLADNSYTFGAGVTLGTNEGSNNAERVFRPGSRQAQYVLESQFDGSWSVDFVLTHPWFLKGFFGDPTTVDGRTDDGTTTGNVVTYEHTFDGKFPDTMMLTEQIDRPGGKVDQRVLTGCVVSSVEISVDVEGQAEVSMDGAYATETLYQDVANNGPFSAIDQPTTTRRPLHFGQAKMYRDGATEALVQDASLSLEGNVDMVYELGSRIAADFSPKAIEPDLSYTRLVDPGNFKDRKSMYGNEGDGANISSPAQRRMGEDGIAVELTFNNDGDPQDDTDQPVNKVNWIAEGGLTDSLSKNNVGDPESEIELDVDRIVDSAYVVAENEESTFPQ